MAGVKAGCRGIGLLMFAAFSGATGFLCMAQSTAPNPARPPERVPRTAMDITQLSNEKLDWFLDAKIGMFIHWGLYAGPGRGEWYMENEGVSPEQYAKLATPAAGNEYFDAAQYDPKAWAQLAKDAGMKWMCLTARHHDGFALFDYAHPNAFTSKQTLNRDLFGEYVAACRGAGLKVGVYFSPLNWRYPGYYDVTGTDCAPNKFGYKTDAAHLENARLMKEENYVAVRTLLTKYGKIDHIYWDGGWLAQRGSDADAAFFHEPGKFMDPRNRWPVAERYWDLDEASGRPLGIMGMVRKHQPDAITNLRYGWIGDILEEEGPRETTGPIRSAEIFDKNLTIQNGSWGYNARSTATGNVMSRDQLVRYVANCTVRNMTILLNVAPDRHGVIPDLQQQRLRELGAWLGKTGESIYGTRGGPWQPTDRQFGYCYKGNTVYVHILKDYAGNTFTVPALGTLRVTGVYDVYTKKPLAFEGSGPVMIRGLDRDASPADTVVGVTYDGEVASIWK